MKYLIFLLFLFSNSVWVNVFEGDVLYLNPENLEWTPIHTKEQISLDTYILSKPNSKYKLFLETDVYEMSGELNFYIKDLLQKSKEDILLELTRIEAKQLKSVPVKKENRKKAFGKVYGNDKRSDKKNVLNIEKYDYTIQYFFENNWHGAALLSQKRLFVRFPSLYTNAKHINRLLELYKFYDFKGFIYDETSRIDYLNKNKIILDISKKYKAELL